MSETIDRTGVTAIWGGRGSGKSTLAKTKIMPQLSGQRVVVIDPMASEGHQTARDFMVALYAGEKRLTLATGNPDEALPAIYAAYAHSTTASPIYAICDEAPAYMDRVTAGLSKIMFQGRHRAFGMCLIGQRVGSVAAQIRSQAALTFYMRLTDHTDLETARKVIGPKASDLPNLKPGEYIAH